MYEKLALAVAIGAVVGVLVQAWRTSKALNCSMKDVLKSGGGPGEADDGPRP